MKLKREIIAFGVDGIDPCEHTSRRVSARMLKQWLDEGRSITLLDTRNNYEIEVGTFANAIAINVDDFRAFRGNPPTPRNAEEADGRDLLHRRHPVREGGTVPRTRRVQGCPSSMGASSIFKERCGGPLQRRVLRLR